MGESRVLLINQPPGKRDMDLKNSRLHCRADTRKKPAILLFGRRIKNYDGRSAVKKSDGAIQEKRCDERLKLR